MGLVCIRWESSLLVLALSFALTGCGPQADSTPPIANAPSGSIDPLFGLEKFAGQAQLQTMYRLAILNTGAQISETGDGTAYVKTGDIPAEWLRDSSAQVRPYLFLVRSSPKMAALVRAVIQRQMKCLAADPYANAFKEDYSIWERKFELDSLAYPILLAWTYWKLTDDRMIFTAELKRGFGAALDTMELEQDHEGHHSTYDHPTLSRHKVGHTGMIWSGFRPSDDPSVYNFIIPSEMMAVQALDALTELELVFGDVRTAARAAKLRREVHAGIQKYGVVHRSKYGDVYAFEVDGLGHSLVMDDANLPSLLSMPYFGYLKSSDSIYMNTRRFILSSDNPYFYSGPLAAGVGSPHTPKGMIWPLALLAQGLTTTNSEEQIQLLQMLLASDPGDHRLHEAFDPAHATRFTREDFGWPNALFAEFIMTTRIKAPSLPVPGSPL